MLARRYRTLASIQMAIAQWDDAERSLAAGASYAQTLLDRWPAQAEFKLLSIQYRLMSAELARACGRLADGEQLARRVSEDSVTLDRSTQTDSSLCSPI